MNRIAAAAMCLGLFAGSGLALARAGTTITQVPAIDPQQGARRFALNGDAFVYWGPAPAVGEFRDLYVQPTDGGPRRKLYDSADTPTSFAGRSAYALSILSDQSTAIFTAPVDGGGEVAVFRAPIDGSSPPVQITGVSDPGESFSIEFNSGESHLIHTGFFDNSGVRRVFATSLDGSGSTIALTPDDSDSAISGLPPSGDRIVYRQGADLSVAFIADGSNFPLGEAVNNVFASDYTTTGETALLRGASFPLNRLYLADLETPNSLTRIDNSSRTFSATFGGDTHAVFTENRALLSYELTTGQVIQLNAGLPERAASRLQPLDDGRLLFGVSRGVGLGLDYYTVQLDGTELKPLTEGAPFDGIDSLRPTPTNSNLAVAVAGSDTAAREELYLIDLTGEASPQPLSNFSATIEGTAFGIDEITLAAEAPIVTFGASHGLTPPGDINNLYVASTDGSDWFRQLTDLPDDQRIANSRLSSDGRWAVLTINDYNIDEFDSGDTPIDATGVYAVDTMTGDLFELAALQADRLAAIHGFAGDTNRLLFTVNDNGELPKSFSVNLVPAPEPTAVVLAAGCASFCLARSLGRK